MKFLAVRSHALRESVRLLLRQRARFALALALASTALAVPLSAVWLARSAAPWVAKWPIGPEISLFMAATATPQEIEQLQAALAERPQVMRVEWIRREAALDALARRTAGALGELKPDVLPDVLVVAFSTRTAPEAVERTIAELRRLPRVESVAADVGWHRKFAAALGVATSAGIAAAAAAAVLLILIVIAAVRLPLALSEDEVRINRLVGADDRFVARPLVYAGALMMAAAAVIAWAIAGSAASALAPSAAELARLYDGDWSVQPPPGSWLAAWTAASAALGAAVAAATARLQLGRRRGRSGTHRASM